LLFIHAYQSYLYNKIVSKRIEQGLPIHMPVEGDLVLPASGHDPLPGREAVLADASRLKRLERQCALGRAVVSAPLYGYETPLAEGEPAKIEQAVIREAGFEPEAFRSPMVPEIASKGLRRGILTPVSGLDWSVEDAQSSENEGGSVVTLRFALPKGAYATTFLREILKLEDTSLY
jgi:tRNA pseudouridine13 synthase